MKTSVLFLSISVVCTTSIVGQNYMGMSQSRIVKSIGEPDEIGINYYVYNDPEEGGDNIYYFDENGNCNSFEIIRDMSYLVDYQKMLKNEFTEACYNKYVRKTKKINFFAELTLSQEVFQIKISDVNDAEVKCKDLLMTSLPSE